MLLHTKSTQANVRVAKKKNYSKKYSLPKKTTQVIYASKSVLLLYTTKIHGDIEKEIAAEHVMVQTKILPIDYFPYVPI